ncbi:MAG: AI-2E family transporter [Thermodesulfobacteriota bacterium]
MSNQKPEKFYLTLQHYFLFVVIAVILFFVCSMMKPYANSIIMGILLSFLFMPLNNKFLIYTKKRKNISALLSSCILAFLVVIPVLFIVTSILFQGINSFQAIYKWFDSGNFSKFTSDIEIHLESLRTSFPLLTGMIPDTSVGNGNFEKQVIDFFSRSLKWLMGQGSQILGSTLSIGMNFFLMMLVFFIMIRDQDKIIDSFLHIIPLKQSHERKIIEKTRELFKSVVLGNVFTSAAQGVAGGIGFAIAGLPPVFWGAVIGFASLIPVVGTALIWIPAAAWLYFSGSKGMSLFIVIWFVLIVGFLDNFLRPVFMKSDQGMSPMLIFFAILGGINVWGILGLIYGPMVFGLGFIMIYIYQIEFSEYLKYQDDN